MLLCIVTFYSVVLLPSSSMLLAAGGVPSRTPDPYGFTDNPFLLSALEEALQVLHIPWGLGCGLDCTLWV